MENSNPSKPTFQFQTTNEEWKPPINPNSWQHHKFLQGICNIIGETYPELTLYLTKNGWERKKIYE